MAMMAITEADKPPMMTVRIRVDVQTMMLVIEAGLVMRTSLREDVELKRLMGSTEVDMMMWIETVGVPTTVKVKAVDVWKTSSVTGVEGSETVIIVEADGAMLTTMSREADMLMQRQDDAADMAMMAVKGVEMNMKNQVGDIVTKTPDIKVGVEMTVVIEVGATKAKTENLGVADVVMMMAMELIGVGVTSMTAGTEIDVTERMIETEADVVKEMVMTGTGASVMKGMTTKAEGLKSKHQRHYQGVGARTGTRNQRRLQSLLQKKKRKQAPSLQKLMVQESLLKGIRRAPLNLVHHPGPSPRRHHLPTLDEEETQSSKSDVGKAKQTQKAPPYIDESEL
eukprot:TRINITY_DN26436_c0_g1_i1.p1 TRINITY_DN26436_c0_g1~~TRINITY_DN26436_c0_g1_i1.p1  ORF type:complete len:360 (+),score=63.43 TRINITY_DN26436_c0_g1_i1:64-1080(+)